MWNSQVKLYLWIKEIHTLRIKTKKWNMLCAWYTEIASDKDIGNKTAGYITLPDWHLHTSAHTCTRSAIIHIFCLRGHRQLPVLQATSFTGGGWKLSCLYHPKFEFNSVRVNADTTEGCLSWKWEVSCVCVLLTANTQPWPWGTGKPNSFSDSIFRPRELKVKYFNVWLRHINASLMPFWLLN